MKSVRRILSFVLAFAICFSTLFFSQVNVLADASETFLLEISAPETALPGDTIDVVITIKDIKQELYGVEFILEYDETKLSPVYTNYGADMDIFMTVVPMYIMSVNGIEIETKAFEQICTCDTKNGRYTCRFLDLIAYPMEKPGQVHNSLINDGDLVVTIPFVVKEDVSYGDTLDFYMIDGSVKGTIKKTVSSTKGTSTTASTKVIDNEMFEIKFVDENGNEISSGTYHYGDTVVIPEAPQKPADETYTYNFAGWDKDVTAVTGNATYKATYTAEYVDYIIKFVDENGNEISSKTYHYGDTVVIPEAPQKPADETYTYKFAGWDKDVTAVTGNTTYKATYTAEYVDYIIKFVDENGNEISSKTYHYGDTVVIPEAPQKPADETYTYKFAGWDKDVTAVTGNATYKATYTAEYVDYIIKFIDENGNEISSKTYHYGDTVVIPEAPEKAGNETYTYKFAGWDKDVTAVTGNTTYKATYTAEYVDYIIKFIDENGNEISSKTYHYGDTVVIPEAPEKAGNETYTYKFAGWDKDVTAVTGNATYKATYTAEYVDYIIKFVDENGNEISSKTYHYGDTVVIPEAPIKANDKLYSYVFLGWDKEIVVVTSDEVYTATYSYYCSKFSENDNYYIDVENGYMKNIPEKTLVSDVIDAFAKINVSVTIKDKNGNVMDGNKYIGTGCTLTEEYGNKYTVIIMGDVDGSGVVDSTDYVIIKRVFLKTTSLEGAYFVAADTETDGAITSTDYIQIKKYFLGTRNLYN